jgi:hypothetical protein
LLRLRALLRQWYSISSFKFFIWNFVTGDESPRNWATILNKPDSNFLFRYPPSLRGYSGGTGRSSTLVMSPGYHGRIFRKDFGWVWTMSSQNGFVKWSGREINVDGFPIQMVSLLWIFCHKGIVSVHKISSIRHWSH